MALKSDLIWQRMMNALQNVDPNKRTLAVVFQVNIKRNGVLAKTMSESHF